MIILESKKAENEENQHFVYLCQTISDVEFFLSHIVKFDAGLVLFS